MQVYMNLYIIFYKLPLLKLGNSLTAMVTAHIFLHFFWFFGINGGSVVGAVYNSILKILSAENLEAFKVGAGSTLSLLIAMVVICKSKRIKSLGKLSILPGIFGINEPIIFGLPIMLNPILLIPFVLVPTVNIIIAYFCMSSGLVPLTNGVQIPWATPVIFSGWLTTGWQGAVLQIALLILGVFMYLPFIKILDKQYLKEEENGDNKEEEDDLSFEDLNI